jgi:hypothetical protein
VEKMKRKGAALDQYRGKLVDGRVNKETKSRIAASETNDRYWWKCRMEWDMRGRYSKYHY